MILTSQQDAIKVLIVTCTYPHDRGRNEGTFVANWAEQLKTVGCNIRVYKRDHLTFGSYLKSFTRAYEFYRYPHVFVYDWHGIPVHRHGIHLRMPLDYSKSAPRLTYKKMKPEIKRIYQQFAFDLVYLATWGDLSLAMSWIAREMNIPYVASAIGDHTNNYYDKPDSIYFKYHREIFLGSEFVICVSDDLNRKVHIMTEGKANTMTFYSGVDTTKFCLSPDLRSDFRRRLGYTEEDFVILFVGRLTESKGIYELLEVFAQLAATNLSLKLLLVGPLVENAKLKKHIRSYGIGRNITFTGGVDHEDIPGYMNAADVFVLPSWMEGLPNVIMEACACERPVLASAVGGIPEVIENNITGFLITPKAPTDLAASLRLVIANPEVATEIAKTAREKILRKFNYHENGRILLNRLDTILGRNKESK